MKPSTVLLTALTLLAAPALLAESFYSGPTFFSKRPEETKSLTNIERFGPVGMSIDLIRPAFTMRIKSIEEGSPAVATGKFKPGRIIGDINGAPLKDIDPRTHLCDIITAAEATDGILKLAIKGETTAVTVIQSPCSDRIVPHGRSIAQIG